MGSMSKRKPPTFILMRYRPLKSLVIGASSKPKQPKANEVRK